MTHHIEEFKLEKAPATAYYIPNFVNKEEEKFLLNKIYSVPKPKWTQLSNRRLQNWGGTPHPKGMLAELIPQWLFLYLDKIHELGVFKNTIKPNHVLINEYLAGQGIMPHFDGPLFFPTIATLSLGSYTVLNFYLPKLEDDGNVSEVKEKLFSLLIEPRSLLILQDDMYCKYLHGIEEKVDDVLSSSEILNWNACDVSQGRCEGKQMNIDADLSTPRITSCEVSNEVESKSRNETGEEQTMSEDICMEDPQDSEFLHSERTEQKLLCTSDEKIHHGCIHKFQRDTRVSLTMRHVPKTSKVKIKLGK